VCLSAGSPIGAAVVARAVVEEAVAKDHGVAKGDLKTKIDRLHADGHITETMRAAATEIRFAGNEAARGDVAAVVTEEPPRGRGRDRDRGADGLDPGAPLPRARAGSEESAPSASCVSNRPARRR
jgi:hypothetical protein